MIASRTAALLPVKNIIAACELGIKTITDKRAEILESEIIWNMKSRWRWVEWLIGPMTRKEAEARVNDDWFPRHRCYRGMQLDVCERILPLAKATSRIEIYISSEDFEYLERFYVA